MFLGDISRLAMYLIKIIIVNGENYDKLRCTLSISQCTVKKIIIIVHHFFSDVIGSSLFWRIFITLWVDFPQ